MTAKNYLLLMEVGKISNRSIKRKTVLKKVSKLDVYVIKGSVFNLRSLCHILMLSSKNDLQFIIIFTSLYCETVTSLPEG